MGKVHNLLFGEMHRVAVKVEHKHGLHIKTDIWPVKSAVLIQFTDFGDTRFEEMAPTDFGCIGFGYNTVYFSNPRRFNHLCTNILC